MTPTRLTSTIFPEPAALTTLLTAWMPQQRWYTGKGGSTELLLEGYLELPGNVRTYLVRDVASPTRVLYQVPLSAYPLGGEVVQPDVPASAVVGEVEGIRVIDGAQDERAAIALLDAALAQRRLEGGSRGTRSDGVDPTEGRGHRAEGEGAVRSTTSVAQVTGARMMKGEQSNSSIVYTTQGDGPDLIGKVFRMIHPGVNPDVEVQEALAAEGCTLVPAPAGDITGTWLDEDAEDARGHLFFAQEFIPGATDAWRVATEAAAAGTSFGERAHALGEATAQVHVALAQALPSRPADDSTYERQLAMWRGRLAQAVEAVPDLARHEKAILAVYAAAADDDWPELQRIHGDYHLGQVLDVPGRGWILLDFEGEPLRPLHERTAPDLATRDVAGMLRSFDYAAGAVEQEDPSRSAAVRGWASEARSAFLGGYASVMPPVSDPQHHRALLDALELDKALYEVVYEARNRPDWIDIPLRGIRRILTAD